MTLNHKLALSGLMILFGGCLLAVDREWIRTVGILLLAGGVVYNAVAFRCPHCGTWLGRRPGTFCRECGEEIDYNAAA